MGDKTKIEWADSTWNPVTGCLHGCEYCYARKIAERFTGCDKLSTYGIHSHLRWKCVNPGSDLKDALFETSADRPPLNVRFNSKTQKTVVTIAPYPFGFHPTLHRHKLDEPMEWKKPRTIFVCSMADLFGDWVPDRWIEDVFAACKQAPQHRYLFLTKNPKRYLKFAEQKKLPEDDNMWYGTTVTTQDERYFFSGSHNTFLSVEPILGEFNQHPHTPIYPKWVIIGAETGNRKGKVKPQPEWVREITKTCIEKSIGVFMKDSLLPIIGEDNMFREIPWDEGTWEIERQQQWLDRYYEEVEK